MISASITGKSLLIAQYFPAQLLRVFWCKAFPAAKARPCVYNFECGAGFLQLFARPGDSEMVRPRYAASRTMRGFHHAARLSGWLAALPQYLMLFFGYSHFMLLKVNG